ncbi:MAG TPA: tripartite tricarboxylate transporter substrate binding protein [Burkholderiaceae bacterium]|nr:tripartite tricarboxylate transporter substrate binding protein [Burkholderiaceae bacterium]
MKASWDLTSLPQHPTAAAGDPTPDGGRRNVLRLAALAALPMLPGAVWAQDAYPSKPIRVIVPYPAGGVVDLVTRAVTERATQALKQPLVVEARPGANANIGAEAAARAPADGYTLLAAAPFLATNPLLAPNVRWKTDDFTGVVLIGAPPNLFCVAPTLPVKTLRELVDYVKARPNQVNVTNPGIGSSNHMGQELFFSITGLEMVNVMYKGQPQMIPDLASGQVAFGLVTLALAMPHIREGRLRPLAVSAPKRVPELPDVPTVAEAGFPDAMFLPWYGIVAPAGTPPQIVRRLSDEFTKALATPEVVTRLETMGTMVTPAPADEFDRLIRSEVQRWTRVIRERNIKAE